MIPFTKVKRAVTYQRRSLEGTPNPLLPFQSRFTKQLRSGTTVELAHLKVSLRNEKTGILLGGTVNWSTTFPGPASNTGGWAEITFELLRNKTVICRVHQTAVQSEINSDSRILPQITVFRIAGFRHFDTTSVFGKTETVRYALRATNIVTVDPAGENAIATTAKVGSVTLTAQLIEAGLPAS